MADKYLNNTGLQYFYNRIKTVFALKTELPENTSDLTNDSDFQTSTQVSSAINTAIGQIEIPTKTSDLINDGDGTSNFATESYVNLNGGKIDVIKVNGTAQTITNKEVDLTIPTTTSQLTNNSDFQTSTQVQALIDSELAGITGIDFQVVTELPASGVKGTIYLLQNQTSQTDIYDEYIWVTLSGGTAHWEQIGTTAVDFSNYWSKSDLTAITTAEIDTIVV